MIRGAEIFFWRLIELSEKREPFVGEDLFFLLEIAQNHGNNGVVLIVRLLGYNWTNLCEVWANFRMRLCKVLDILGKFIKDNWTNYLEFLASLGNYFGQIRTCPNRFGQFNSQLPKSSRKHYCLLIPVYIQT